MTSNQIKTISRNSPSADLFNKHIRLTSLVQRLSSNDAIEMERASVVVETWVSSILQAAFEGRKQVTVPKNFEDEEEFERETQTSCEAIKEYIEGLGWSINFQWGYKNRGFVIKFVKS